MDKSNQSRFILQPSEKVNHWVCTDQVNKIVVIFEQGNFNDSQEFKLIEDFDPTNVSKAARIATEIAEWLCKNHPDKIN